MVSTILVIWPWYLTGVIVEKAKLESWSIEWRVYSVILVFPSHYLMEIYDFSSHGSIYQCNSYSRFSTADAISDIRLKELGTKRRLLGRGKKKERKEKEKKQNPLILSDESFIGSSLCLTQKRIRQGLFSPKHNVNSSSTSTISLFYLKTTREILILKTEERNGRDVAVLEDIHEECAQDRAGSAPAHQHYANPFFTPRDCGFAWKVLHSC